MSRDVSLPGSPIQPLLSWILAVCCILASAAPAFSQIEDVRAAIAQKDHLGALRILSGISDDSATPDTYLYRGIAYANLRQYKRALGAFREGFNRYPTDPRFHSEGAAFYRRTREIVDAKAQLRTALIADPGDVYASELLASLDLSDGNIGPALSVLNQGGQPQIARILDNYSLTFSSSTESSALAFRPGAVLHLSEWKTTAARLKATKAFAGVGLELESSLEGGKYNALVRSSKKSNTASGFLLGLLEGLPVKTSYLDIWNIGGSFVQWTSKYRWDPARRRAEGQLLFPVPLPGLLFVELGGVWRSEQWDIPSQGQFQYKSSGVRLNLKHIPDHRLELGAGLEYLNRAAGNTGRVLLNARFRPIDRKFKSQVRVDSFLARASLLGDLNYTGGTIQLANRLVVSEDRSTFFDLSVKVGTSRGRLPVEDYFMLGIDTETVDPLRAHVAADHSRYGRGPMGTGFVLVNSDIERRVAALPVLNNVPIHGELFFDSAKLSDRNRIFQQRGWLFDAGVAVRTQLPDFDFVVLYGRNLSEGKGVLGAYIERRFW
jgi:tetratricopeptide (TPR) repeat protein